MGSIVGGAALAGIAYFGYTKATAQPEGAFYNDDEDFEMT